MAQRRRVVVTGIGMVTPHGLDREIVMDRILEGVPAIRKVRSGREGVEGDVLVGEVEFDPTGLIEPVRLIGMDPVAQIGLHAARLALVDAGLVDPDVEYPCHLPELEDAGVYFGCSLGGVETFSDGHETYHTGRRRRAKPTIVPRVMPNAAAGHISMVFGVRGPTNTWSVACTSSSAALGEAFRAIRDGYLDCVIAGGTEAMQSAPVLIAWESMGVLAQEHADGPGASVRPFDRARTGFALSEGAIVLILEAEARARARGARVLGEILGYGASSDALHLTKPAADGQARAMRGALADAEVEAGRIGYVNAHATATPVGDVVEVEAIRAALGAQAERVTVSSTKAVHGHMVGAAGAMEAAVTLLALRRGVLPSTANLTDPDPACDLDLLPDPGRSAAGVDLALSNSFGFGGSNGVLVLGRGPDF